MTVSPHLPRLAGSFLLVCILGGCGSTRVYEVSTAAAQRFDWTGKVRIVELSPYRVFGPAAFEVRRVELLGRGGRNVVIEPYNGDSGHLLIATVAENGRDIKQVLNTKLLGQSGHDERLRATGRTEQDSRIMLSLQALQHLAKSEFDQIDAIELHRAAADASPMEAVYKIDDRHLLREKTRPDGYCEASIEAPDGKVLHTWKQQRLDVSVKQE